MRLNHSVPPTETLNPARHISAAVSTSHTNTDTHKKVAVSRRWEGGEAGGNEGGGLKWSSHSNHDRHTQRYIMAKDTPNWQKSAHHLLNVPPPTTPSQMTQYNLTDSPRNDGFTDHSPDIQGGGGRGGEGESKGGARGGGSRCTRMEGRISSPWR